MPEFGLVGEAKWYNHTPVRAVENEMVKILWDFNTHKKSSPTQNIPPPTPTHPHLPINMSTHPHTPKIYLHPHPSTHKKCPPTQGSLFMLAVSCQRLVLYHQTIDLILT